MYTCTPSKSQASCGLFDMRLMCSGVGVNKSGNKHNMTREEHAKTFKL